MTRALVLIDIQTGMDSPLWGARNTPTAENNAARFLTHFRAKAAPLAHVMHFLPHPDSPLSPDNGGNAIKSVVTPLPGEAVRSKHTNSAFIDTTLEQYLQDLCVDGVLIAGMLTPQCISTSVRMATNLGFDVWLAHDACAAFDIHAEYGWNPAVPRRAAEHIHNCEVSILHGEFCQARTTNEIPRAMT